MLIKEHRIIGLRLTDIQKMQKDAGVTPSVAPYNPRAAQENASVQDANRAQALLTNSANAVKQAAIDAKTPVRVGTDINGQPIMKVPEPLQVGINADGTPIMQKNFSGITSDPNALNRIKEQASGGLSGQNFLNNQQNTYANQANAGMYNSVAENGQVSLAPTNDSFIRERAIINLRKNGFTDQQIREKLNDPAYMADIRQTMSNTGLPSTDRQNATVRDTIQARLAEVDASIAARNNAGNFVDSNEAAILRQNAINQYNTEQADQASQNKAAQEKEATNAASSALGAMNDQAVKADQANMLSGVDPKAVAMAPFLKPILDQITQGQKDNASVMNAMLNGGTVDVNGNKVEVRGINSLYDAQEKQFNQMKQDYISLGSKVNDMLDLQAKQQQEQITKNQKAQEDRLAWEELKLTRQNAKDKQAAVDAKIAFLAVTGRASSSGGQNELEQTKIDYENKLDDIKQEFGVQRTDLAAKFSGLFLEASTNHLNASIANIKDTYASLERVQGQSMTGAQNRMNATNTILSNFVEANNASKKELIGALQTAQKEMDSAINAKRDDERAAQENMRDAALKYVDTYGTQNKAALSFYENELKLPLGSLSDQKTIEELKMKKVGGGGASGFETMVDNQRKQLMEYYPNASGEKIDQLVYAALSTQLNNANLGKAYAYMSSNRLKGEVYRIQPFLTAGQGQKIIEAATQQLDDQRAIETGDMTPSDLVSSLKDLTDAKGERVFSDENIVQYMKDIGFVHVPGLFKTFKNEFTKQ